MWAQLLQFAIGIWLMAAPDVLGYGGLPADHHHVVGPLIATFGLVAAWQVTRPLRWAAAALGLWLVVAPWILGYSGTTAARNAILWGLIVAVLGLFPGKSTQAQGGGWSLLWRGTDGSR